MIIFDDVSKVYRIAGGYPVVVLENFSCAFTPGCNVGILGRNGSGKSTLIRLALGAEPPTSGTIEREGLVSWPLGTSGGFDQRLTARQNLRFIARLYNQDYREMVDYVESFSAIGPFFDEPLRRCSNGMRARVNFATSMAIPFDFYLIDEVIGAGDQPFQERCSEVLKERRRDTTLLLVSQSANRLRMFCDVAGVIEDGRVTFYDTIAEATEAHEENLKRVEIGR